MHTRVSRVEMGVSSPALERGYVCICRLLREHTQDHALIICQNIPESLCYSIAFGNSLDSAMQLGFPEYRAAFVRFPLNGKSALPLQLRCGAKGKGARRAQVQIRHGCKTYRSQCQCLCTRDEGCCEMICRCLATKWDVVVFAQGLDTTNRWRRNGEHRARDKATGGAENTRRPRGADALRHSQLHESRLGRFDTGLRREREARPQRRCFGRRSMGGSRATGCTRALRDTLSHYLRCGRHRRAIHAAQPSPLRDHELRAWMGVGLDASLVTSALGAHSVSCWPP